MHSSHPVESKSNASNPCYVFITTAPTDPSFAQAGTGDIDYANTLKETLEKNHQEMNVDFIPTCKDEESLYDEIFNKTANGATPVLHLMANAPNIGFMLTPKGLQKFKDRGGKVIVTAVEFAKHQDNILKSKTLRLLETADHAIFLDVNDQQDAINYAKRWQIKIPNSSVICVPATVPSPNKPLNEREKNILCFGMIREGKGLAHVTKLANLIQNHPEEKSSNQHRKILIIGSILKADKDKKDESLYNIMKQMYPSKINEMIGKKPTELANLLKQYHEEKLEPALPIEVHIDVPRADLPALFDSCRYSYLPAYRGATLRNSSISSSIANKFITYAHEGKITPAELLPNGKHAESLKIIPYDRNKKFYDYSAESVLVDITNREKDAALNNATEKAMSDLVNEKLSPTIFAKQHANVYSSILPLQY